MGSGILATRREGYRNQGEELSSGDPSLLLLRSELSHQVVPCDQSFVDVVTITPTSDGCGSDTIPKCQLSFRDAGGYRLALCTDLVYEV